MPKKTAVLAVDPVNGSGLFQYLEAFYENKIPYKVFAVAPTKEIKTNSGIALTVDGTVAELKGHADRYDALVFACGDAMPVFGANADKPYNVDMLEVVREFAGKEKILIGHCAAALVFEMAGVDAGRRVAVHPLAKAAIKNGIPTDNAAETDGNFYTAREEHAIPAMLPGVVEALK